MQKTLNTAVSTSIAQAMGIPKDMVENQPDELKYLQRYSFNFDLEHINGKQLADGPPSLQIENLNQATCLPSKEFLNKKENTTFTSHIHHDLKSNSENIAVGWNNEIK